MVRYPLQWSHTIIPFFRPAILINHNMGITLQVTYQVITRNGRIYKQQAGTITVKIAFTKKIMNVFRKKGDEA